MYAASIQLGAILSEGRACFGMDSSFGVAEVKLALGVGSRTTKIFEEDCYYFPKFVDSCNTC